MWVLNCEIEIGKYTFNGALDVKIERSPYLISDTAIITLPLEAIFSNKYRGTIHKEIKMGDKVVIRLGYDDSLREEFTGYIKDVSATDKTVVICEDQLFLIRKPLENKLFKNAKLVNIAAYIAGAGGLKLSKLIPDIEIESFLIKDITAAQALLKLKDGYGLQAYIDYEGALFIGLPYLYNTGNIVLDLRKNVIKSDLIFKESDEIKYKIKAVSILKNNKRIEVEAGDEDGDLRTLYFYGIGSEPELKKIAANELAKYKYSGYRGNLTTFGDPFSRFGMSAIVRDDNYPDRDGAYYIESVKINYGAGGFRRIIELGIKL